MATIGGYLVDPETGAWRRLPEIRRAIREWQRLLDPAAAEALADVMAEDEIAALLDRLAPHVPVAPATRVSSGEFPYWSVEPATARQLHDRLESIKQSDQRRLRTPALDPVADRVAAIVFDDHERAAFADACKRHINAPGKFLSTGRSTYFLGCLQTRADTPERVARLIAAAELVHRAVRLAVYWRTFEYLETQFPGWLDRLNVKVPLGAERQFDALRRGQARHHVDGALTSQLVADYQVPVRWIGAWWHWVEQFDFRLIEKFPQYRQGPAAWEELALLLPADVHAERELAALFELAFDDVWPEPAGTQPIVWRALTLLLFYEEYAKEVFALRAPADRMERLKRATIPIAKRAERRGPNGGEPRKEAGAAANGQKSKPAKPTADLGDLDERLTFLARQPRALKLAQEFSDIGQVHAWAAALRQDASERRRDRTIGLSKAIRYVLRRVEGPETDLIMGLIDSAQMLSFDTTSLAPHLTDELFIPLLEAIPRGVLPPLAANIWRSVAIQYSKVHEYAQAQSFLYHAVDTLIEAATEARNGADERTETNLIEATQQVSLQSTGLHCRILEMLLSHPVLQHMDSQREIDEEMSRMRLIARAAVVAGGHAYTTLNKVKDIFQLPEVKQQTRAATQSWEVNTRCMYMRALLLLGTLEAADGESGHGSRAEAKQRMLQLVEAVPQIYRETTSFPLANLPNEVTRIAMHYAFLRGMRFMEPGRTTGLPPHLVRPMKVDVADQTGCGVFDVQAATAYLEGNNNDAGILGNITCVPVRRALAYHSHPHEQSRLMNYEKWLREQKSLEKLRREFGVAQFRRASSLLLPPPIVDIEL
jgi:hypothetical protein